TRAFTQRPSNVVAGVTTILFTIRPHSLRRDQLTSRAGSIALSSLAAVVSNCRPSPTSSISVALARVGVRSGREASAVEKRADRRENLFISTLDRKCRWPAKDYTNKLF